MYNEFICLIEEHIGHFPQRSLNNVDVFIILVTNKQNCRIYVSVVGVHLEVLRQSQSKMTHMKDILPRKVLIIPSESDYSIASV